MQPLLKVQALSKTFNIRAGLFSRKKFDVLKNISFCIGKGETIAIIGETGSGKSTLAKLLVGAYSADSGQILLENNTIENNGNRDAQCRYIRMIFTADCECHLRSTRCIAEPFRSVTKYCPLPSEKILGSRTLAGLSHGFDSRKLLVRFQATTVGHVSIGPLRFLGLAQASPSPF